jgi:hypothetical protein
MRADARSHKPCAPRRFPQPLGVLPAPRMHRGWHAEARSAPVARKPRCVAAGGRATRERGQPHKPAEQLFATAMPMPRRDAMINGNPSNCSARKVLLRSPLGQRVRRGRLWEPPRSAANMAARFSAHQRLTRGGCPSAVSRRRTKRVRPRAMFASTGGNPRAARAARSGAGGAPSARARAKPSSQHMKHMKHMKRIKRNTPTEKQINSSTAAS